MLRNSALESVAIWDAMKLSIFSECTSGVDGILSPVPLAGGAGAVLAG